MVPYGTQLQYRSEYYQFFRWPAVVQAGPWGSMPAIKKSLIEEMKLMFAFKADKRIMIYAMISETENNAFVVYFKPVNLLFRLRKYGDSELLSDFAGPLL